MNTESLEARGELAEARKALGMALTLRLQYSVMADRLERLDTELNPNAALTANRLRNLRRLAEHADDDLARIEEEIEVEEENLGVTKTEREELVSLMAVKALEISEQLEVVNEFEKKNWLKTRERDFDGRLKSDHLELYDWRWWVFEDVFKKGLREERGKLVVRGGFVLGAEDGDDEGLWLTEAVYARQCDWVTLYQGDLSMVETLFFRPAWNEEPVGVFRRVGFDGRRVELQGAIDSNGIYKARDFSQEWE